ncbi:Acetamidase/Formamidase [Sistotremastrum niveocremeum HHB9708]|uniref:Acetamidase/Formamidase n=1 Tax=Sistotremastrum niveocremeum HHB9708 TaxID=1314777 RepID=A0A164MYT7_9AGAM|nr:Acetamidase/Formamidase [Sistotremastrum niveocremeum HHB9708]
MCDDRLSRHAAIERRLRVWRSGNPGNLEMGLNICTALHYNDDVRDINLHFVHNLIEPVAVKGAEPGDCLVVKIPWAYTGIFELNNGGGLFAKEFQSRAGKAIWDCEGIYATSRQIPGVRFAGVSHPGLISSTELLAQWNKCEGELIAEHPCAVPAVAFPPDPQGAYLGGDVSYEIREKFAREGMGTIPGREHDGNCGSRCYFPVFVEGANLSLSYYGAIEMAGIITFKCSIIKNGIEKLALRQPIFPPSPIDPLYSPKLIFEDGHGKQNNMVATVAYKQAVLNAIGYLQKLACRQAYLILSATTIESQVGAVTQSSYVAPPSVPTLTDSLNPCVTLALPLGALDHDILPKSEGLEKRNFGQCAIRSNGFL